MLQLNELSKIGFGCYRVTVDSEEHYKAVLLALSLGCNVMDTSSNYMDGKSEELIGKVLNDNPQYKTFIITKAGYVQGQNLQVINKLHALGLALDNLVHIDENFKYSLHPDFLQNQIDKSLLRLQIDSLDGFLLHNPEYYFAKDRAHSNEIYTVIEKAFEFLEDKVKERKVRFYGISSNVFTTGQQNKKKLSLEKVLLIAQNINPNHHFKLIQFPFNLLEQGPKIRHNHNNSLIEFARQNNIVTFSNRPLNANSDNGAVRLATYQDDITGLDEENDNRIFQQCLDLIDEQLIRLSIKENAMAIDIISYMAVNWKNFSTSDDASMFFDRSFYPFLMRLYQNNIPHAHLKLYSKLRRITLCYSLKNVTQNAIDLRRELIYKGLISAEDKSALPTLACKYYLDAGIDHVLVGMKKQKYVKDFQPLFFYDAGPGT